MPCRRAWPLPAPLAVRVAIHAGDAQEREADFYGPVVNRCARPRAIGHGGQTLLSAAAVERSRKTFPRELIFAILECTG